MRALVFALGEDDAPRVVQFARQLGAVVDVVVAASHLSSGAARIAGVGRVLAPDRPCDGSAEAVAALLASLASEYDVVAAEANSLCGDALPRAAAQLGAPMVSHVVAIEDGALLHPVQAGRAIAATRVDPLFFCTVRGDAFAAAPLGSHPAPIVPVPAPPAGDTIRLVRAAARHTDSGLTQARAVVGLGRGAANPAFSARAAALAEALGAAVAGTRPAVDAGAVPESALVGQSGRSISPDLYIALGVSGAWQHFAGVRDAKTIVAINSDAHAPIFEWADYAWVADLEGALPELLAALKR